MDMASAGLQGPMKVMYFLPPLASFWLTAFGLEIAWHYVALVVGSAIAGALVLGYYRPEKTFFRSVYKTVIASMAGMIFGSVVVAWRTMEHPAYVAATYCVCSMVVLFLLKSVIGYGERNAEGLTRTIFERIFNVEKKDLDAVKRQKRTARRGGVHVSHAPDTTVVIDKSAVPDEVRVIEQTVVETKKDGGK